MKLKIQGIVEDMARTQPLDKIRIQDICAAAEISMGNFYQYFSCKEEAMIYSYQFIDREWQERHVEQIENGLERALAIIDMHLETIASESLCFITQLYISQLKFYDEYFFTRHRYLHQAMTDALTLAQQAGDVTEQYDAHALAIKLLNFSRGLVYNYCIQHKETPQTWLPFAEGEQREYLQLFLTEQGRQSLRALSARP